MGELNQWARNAADAVIGVLNDRGGFDGWWGDIDDETSTEIMDEMAAAIQRELPPPAADGAVVEAIALIAAERRRQVESEGWSSEHDDEHAMGELLLAAQCYAWAGRQLTHNANERMNLQHVHSLDQRGSREVPVPSWPWSKAWWKPGADPVRALVKAGALIAAEIDRLQRVQSRPTPSGDDHG